MLLLTAEALRFYQVAGAMPHSRVWGFLHWHQTHVPWVGCSLHDLIQPSFTFLVGVALPFSLANRQARAQSAGAVTLHAFRRAIVLVFLGIFLRSLGQSATEWTFEDTLTQIGLGYGFLFLLAQRTARAQWLALGCILAGYWLAFALWPLPGPDFDWAHAEVLRDSPHHLTGFAAHWNKNTNVAAAFEHWFLNLFPREEHFTANPGGYVTLSFIPTLGTMILGLRAGSVLRSDRAPGDKVRWLVVAGLLAIGLGSLLGALGVCPVVKRIWTPSWVLFSGGWAFLFLAAFYTLIDWRGWRAWAFPLIVVGMNSIAAYCLDWVAPGSIRDALTRHFDPPAGREQVIPRVDSTPAAAEGSAPKDIGSDNSIFELFGAAYAPAVQGLFVVVIIWCILHWMYRRKIFLRI